MKVSLDTNVLISYLLFPDRDTTPRRVVWAALDVQYELRLSEQTIHELTETVRFNSYLGQRIEESFLQEFIQQLRDMGEISPGLIDKKEERIVRDPKDDYLIAHAISAEADYLVTGDKDLLVLERIGDILIVTPAEFMWLLEQTES